MVRYNETGERVGRKNGGSNSNEFDESGNVRGTRQNLTLSALHPNHFGESTSPPPSTMMVTIRTSPSFVGRSREDNYVALDCEMVGVGPGGRQSVLARVSVVGYHGDVLLDTYVKVEERVTDYRTFVSGVTMDHLRSSQAKDFGQVRSAVQRLLFRKILVGHALENDLQVLRIHHPQSRIRDTSLYEPFMKVDYFDGTMRPRRLRDLTAHHLGRYIQRDGESHDSIEDAKAAMELYKSVQATWEYAIGWKHGQAFQQAPLYHFQPIRYAQEI